MSNEFYRSFAEFEREMLRPGRRVGQSVEDILDPDVFEREFPIEADSFFDRIEDVEDDDDDE
jgi:hypothetical protein